MAPQQVDWVTQRNRKDKVVEMMKEGDWRRVLQEFQGDDCYREPLLVWIRPSLLSLEFIRQEVTSLGLEAVASVGCGCGTLEWLLQMATGLRVTGYEVNRLWWEGQHSTPHFINIEYVDEVEEKACVIPAQSALMFCYFNNNQYFHKYLDQYQGICVILIGPIDGARHCDPEPDYLQDHPEWALQNRLSLKEEDAISVYRRRGNWQYLTQGTSIV